MKDYQLGRLESTSSSSTSGLLTAIVITLIIGGTIGFVAGYVVSRQQYKGVAGSAASSEYDTHSLGRSRLTRHDGVAKAVLAQQTPPPSSHTPLPLYATLPRHSHQATIRTTDANYVLPSAVLPYHAATLNYEKNLMTTSLNNGTLPKDYKVKKVYL